MEVRVIGSPRGYVFVKGKLSANKENCQVYLEILFKSGEKKLILLPATKGGVINYIFYAEDHVDRAKLVRKDEKPIDVVKDVSIRGIGVIERFLRIYRRDIPILLSSSPMTKLLRKRLNLSLWDHLLRPWKTYQRITWTRYEDVCSKKTYEEFLESLISCLNDAKAGLPMQGVKIELFVFDVGIGDLKGTIESIQGQGYRDLSYRLVKSVDKIENTDADYVGVVFPGEKLAPHAISVCAKYILQSSPAIFYTDHYSEDQFFLKPDFSYEYFLRYDYIHGLVLFKSDLLPLLDLSAGVWVNHRLILKSLEKGINIHHLPVPLLFSPKSLEEEKLRKQCVGLKSLREFLSSKKHIQDVTLGDFPLVFNIEYRLRSEDLVSIIIPTKDKLELIKTCISSIIQKSTYKNYEIIIVDNGSKDGEVFEFYDSLREKPGIKILYLDIPFNFSRLINYGAFYSKGKILCFLNNDVEVLTPDWIERLLKHALREDVGAVGGKLLYPNDTVQFVGAVMGIFGGVDHVSKGLKVSESGYMNRAMVTQEWLVVTGACLMVRRELFERVGGFDERFVVSFNDVDFCLKLYSLGYRNIVETSCILYHNESSSRREKFRKQEMKDLKLLRKRWCRFIENDPYYNPNLSIFRTDFSLGNPYCL